MTLIVQKYGGSSLADADGIKRVAQRIVATRKAGHGVVVVVSAMGDTTDELHDLALKVSPLPPGRELDMLLTAGERISMALVAMAIANLGFEARSFTGSQAGVITDSTHGKARIIDVTPGRISSAITEGAMNQVMIKRKKRTCLADLSQRELYEMVELLRPIDPKHAIAIQSYADTKFITIPADPVGFMPKGYGGHIWVDALDCLVVLDRVSHREVRKIISELGTAVRRKGMPPAKAAAADLLKTAFEYWHRKRLDQEL